MFQIVLPVLWLDFQLTSFLFELDVFHWEYLSKSVANATSCC